MIALILIPTLAAVVLGGLRVATSIGSAAEYQRVREVADLVSGLSNLAHELQLERDLSTRYIAMGRPGGPALDLIHNQYDSVDAAAEQVRVKAGVAGDAFGDLGRQRIGHLKDRLSELDTLRDTALKSQIPPLPAHDKYSQLVADVLRLYDETVQGGVDEQLTASMTAVAALARAEEEASKQRSLLGDGLAKGMFGDAEFDAFLSAQSREASEYESFVASAGPTERQLYDDTVTGTLVDRSEFYRLRANYLQKHGQTLRRLENRSDDTERWFTAVSSKLDKMHEVEKQLSSSIISRSAGFQESDRNLAALNVTLVVIVLLVVLLVTAAVARSLVTPLRRLRTEALEIAGHRLPDLVQRMRESDSTSGPPEVQPIGVGSTDEIGEVARAFDEVHREAVRLAGDEAQLRSNISAMFVNLSRRTQTLVERQITLIDGLEQGEQDEQRLGNLFKLDHLATRMRRNSENLLVLAGQEPARRWSQPVEITDVIRASLSEVEGYERVVLNIPADVSIAGQAVNDVIHLLAELVENALAFSARDTRVIVSGNRIDGGGVMVSVTDSGIGMTPEEIVQANWRLSNPPVVDVSVSRRMGLFVVGRLALRNGIRVQLRPHDGGGLTAMVLLPETLIGTSLSPIPSSMGGSMPGSLSGSYAPSWSPQAEQANWSQPIAMGPGGLSSISGTGPVALPPGLPPSANSLGSMGSLGSSGGPGSPGGPGGMPASGGPTSAWQPPPARRRRHDYDDAATGPMPAVSATPPMSAPPAPSSTDEFLPIFASVESAWFRKPPVAEPASQWQQETAVDAGWQAAAAATEKPSWEGKTTSGLPKRVPKANLVPGSADPSPPPAAPAPAPALSPDRARSRLSSLQQGVRQGRAVARGEISEDQGYRTRSGEQA
ncbi:sensor histidine kinase [Microbispora oryzae]|uniref:sensor histidine kinase n=1 Tax=Microbispora oryzae TaxID=2806554 RepID=UPI001E2A5DE5|nr:nitrate- and nitrite sensing domain-containing protein [Microbispora oryzae]